MCGRIALYAEPERMARFIDAAMGAAHNREPVVLERDPWDIWLGPRNDEREELLSLLHPSVEGTAVHHPVSKDVGNIRNDGPELVNRVDG